MWKAWKTLHAVEWLNWWKPSSSIRKHIEVLPLHSPVSQTESEITSTSFQLCLSLQGLLIPALHQHHHIDSMPPVPFLVAVSNSMHPLPGSTCFFAPLQNSCKPAGVYKFMISHMLTPTSNIIINFMHYSLVLCVARAWLVMDSNLCAKFHPHNTWFLR